MQVSWRWRLMAAAACAGGLMFVVGCFGRSPGSGTQAATAPKSRSALQTEVEDQLKSAIYQLQPENLGIDSRVDDAISVLNNWWAAVKAADMQPTGLTPPAIPQGRIPEPLRPRFESETFDLQDGRHIRAAYLARSIAERVSSQAERDLDRVVRLFDWVCRNVSLVADDDPWPPLTVYELLITGRGRGLDRAWVFSEILRQLRIDAVVLRNKENAMAPALVGVILDGDVYLFDPQLGLPIPRGDAPPENRWTLPATLAQVREHPEWLKALATRSDQPYEVTPEQLAQPQVEAMASLDAWAPRMWNLEQLLPGESLCFLYDPPDTLGDAPGTFARIAAAVPEWKPDDIGVWTYPLQRTVQFNQMQQDANLRRVLQSVTAPLAAPVEIRRHEQTGQSQSVETLRQLKTRTLQLQGQHADAIAHFVTIRQLSVTPPPEASWGPIYQRAAEDAFFWSCVCKYELEEYESAVTSLADYLKRFRRGQWAGAAALLLADCHRALGQTPAALQALKTVAGNDACYPTAAVLLRRWSESPRE